jgi:hypothetical protein
MTVRCFHIRWDQSDNGSDDELAELPSEVTVTIDATGLDAAQINDAVSDALSDDIGYCHTGFEGEVVSLY